MKILWILAGCGLESRSITGGPVRFHEESKQWTRDSRVEAQHLYTTSGGEQMLRRLGCELPTSHVPASLFLKREPFRAFRLWSYIVSALCARRALRKVPACDVAITASDYFCDIVAAMIWKRLVGGEGKWIAWIHHRELPPKERPGNFLVNCLTHAMQQWSFRRIARHADRACVYITETGDAIVEQLCALGMNRAKIHRMRCGIDYTAIHDAPSPTEADDADRVDAVMVGVRPNKGLFDILPVWKEVLRLRPGTTLRLMGGMSGEREELARAEKELGAGIVRVFRPEGGFLPADEYARRLKQARVMFAPSREEGWGIAVCEGMAAGIPVVSWDLPVYRRIFGDGLDVVPCFDVPHFAREIVRMLNDAAASEEQANRGCACAKKYDWKAIADEDLLMLDARR